MTSKLVRCASTQVKCLVLHGYGQNSSMMKERLQLLEVKLQQKGVVLDYLTAQQPASKKPTNAHLRKWWSWNIDPEGNLSIKYTTKYDTLKESKEQVIEHCEKNGPYQILIGFSQGAMLAQTFSKEELPTLEGVVRIASEEPLPQYYPKPGKWIPVLCVANPYDPVIKFPRSVCSMGNPNPHVSVSLNCNGGKAEHAIPTNFQFFDTLTSFIERLKTSQPSS